jgi:hypothetical protein
MTTLRSSFYDNKIEFLKQALYEPLSSSNLVIEDDDSIDEFIQDFANMIRWYRDSEDLCEASEE